MFHMEKTEFSLPERYEKLQITGKPAPEWVPEKSGEELYNILKEELPRGTYENLRRKMTVELLLQSYPELADLEKLNEEFKKTRSNYNLPHIIRTRDFHNILEEAIKEWQVNRTVELVKKQCAEK